MLADRVRMNSGKKQILIPCNFGGIGSSHGYLTKDNELLNEGFDFEYNCALGTEYTLYTNGGENFIDVVYNGGWWILLEWGRFYENPPFLEVLDYGTKEFNGASRTYVTFKFIENLEEGKVEFSWDYTE